MRVNLAARIESANKRYGSSLLISDATYTRLSNRDQFDIRRMERVMVVNRRRPVTMYEVYDEYPAPLRAANGRPSRLLTRPFDCSTPATPIEARAASNDAASCCPTTRSRPCTSPIATLWIGVRYPLVTRWFSQK